MFQIEPLASRNLPRRKEFGIEDYQSFREDLDHYLTQLLVDNTIRNRLYSVPIPDKGKDKIRSYLGALREAVDKADMPEAKRAALHKKLNAFEEALDKPRLNLVQVALIAMAIVEFPGAAWQSYDVVSGLMHKVLVTVAEAKAADDENRRLPPADAPAALLPPRREDFKPKSSGMGRKTSPDDLDDDIPF